MQQWKWTFWGSGFPKRKVVLRKPPGFHDCWREVTLHKMHGFVVVLGNEPKQGHLQQEDMGCMSGSVSFSSASNFGFEGCKL